MTNEIARGISERIVKSLLKLKAPILQKETKDPYSK